MIEKIAAHVGHGKTGSSYIQSSLALSTRSLAKNSISYPVSDTLISRAEKGLMTSGNVLPGRNWAKDIADFASLNQASGTILVSNEGLFRTLFPRGLGQIEASFPNIEVEVLLFARDPLSLAGSAYQEFVKQAKTDVSFSNFLAGFDKPQQVFQFIRSCDSLGIKYKLVNYSKSRRDLLQVVERWLQLEPKTLERPYSKTVNRSINAKEILLLQKMRKYFDAEECRKLGRILCQIETTEFLDRPKATLEQIKQFEKRMEPTIKALHDYLGYELYGEENSDEYIRKDGEGLGDLSEDQVDILCQALSAWKTKNEV